MSLYNSCSDGKVFNKRILHQLAKTDDLALVEINKVPTTQKMQKVSFLGRFFKKTEETATFSKSIATLNKMIRNNPELLKDATCCHDVLIITRKWSELAKKIKGNKTDLIPTFSDLNRLHAEALLCLPTTRKELEDLTPSEYGLRKTLVREGGYWDEDQNQLTMLARTLQDLSSKEAITEGRFGKFIDKQLEKHPKLENICIGDLVYPLVVLKKILANMPNFSPESLLKQPPLLDKEAPRNLQRQCHHLFAEIPINKQSC